MTGHSPITAFALLARRPDEALDLEALTLAIARMGRPELDVGAVSASLDALAASVADAVDPNAPPDRLAAALAAQIGGTLGFRGDTAVYATADGSFLDQVVERRRGLPILLAVVWVLIGRRLGVPVAGVNFPGHFLACVDAPGARVYVDPFHGGQPVDVHSLLVRLGPGQDARRALVPADVRPIVARMLLNLKNLWIDQDQYELALGAVDRLLLIAGERPVELRDRGLLCLHVQRDAEGLRDLRRYLSLQPDAPDREVVERLIARHGES